MSNAQASTLFGIEDFARGYIQQFQSHKDIRTEHLAEAVRSFFGLPSFPTVHDLNRLCDRLGIPVRKLPAGVPMEGANIWAQVTGPEIYVRDDLKIMRVETTICHEIREVIENAFKQVSPTYSGLNTANNKDMNQESDHFAACLLMQADASRNLLDRLCFDLVRFSKETGRSLPSVIIRLQSLYSNASGIVHPHAGVWLFEAPWQAVESGQSNASMLVARYQAQLCGFSMKKAPSQGNLLARELFPTRGTKLPEFGLGYLAMQDQEPMMEHLTGFDMFGDHDYSVVVEPILWRGVSWRLLCAAIRKDSFDLFKGWLDRLAIRAVFHGFQSEHLPSLN